MKELVKDAYALAMYGLGLSRLERFKPYSLLILTFHRVLPEEHRRAYPLPGLAVSPDELRWIIGSLLPHFDVHTVSTAFDRLHGGRPRRPLLSVTFDDGQVDNLRYAGPVLKELGVPATFYLPVDYMGSERLLWHDEVGLAWQAARAHGIDLTPALADLDHGLAGPRGTPASVNALLEILKLARPTERDSAVRRLVESVPGSAVEWARLMTWAEARTLAREGHELGSHSCSHALLPDLDTQQQQRELEDSRDAILRETGERPRSLCYPNGSHDQTTVRLAMETGYENAVTTRWGINTTEQSRYELLRCDMDARRLVNRRAQRSFTHLALRLSGYHPRLPT